MLFNSCRNVWIEVILSLISHPYGDSSAPYLGTAILTILCYQEENNHHTIYEP